MPIRPKARTSDLVVEPLSDETLVYDLTKDRAHCLNRVATIVWRGADGSRDLRELAHHLASEIGAPIEEGEAIVWSALERLRRADLLLDPIEVPNGGRIRRRQVVQGIVLVPVVLSILTPTRGIAFVSAPPGSPPPCRAGGQPCATPTQCCSSNCQSNGTCMSV